MAFQCVVVTPEQQVMDDSITQAILPGMDGLVGVLTDRAPLLMKLGAGPLRIDRGGQQMYYYVEGGVAQMKDNRLTIVTDQAIPASEIDVEAARAEYAEATARVTTDAASAAVKQKQLARARGKQAVAAHK